MIYKPVTVPNRLRLDNVIRIIEALWHQPEKSRADLARELRLDRSTVGIIADRLLDIGMIREERCHKTGPKGGRPPLHLAIAPGTAYTIGMELTVPHIRLLAVDLAGDRLGEVDLPINSYGPDAVNALAAEIARLRRRIEENRQFLLGLVAAGIGVSGLVNQETMSIDLSYALHIYSPLSLKAPLQAVLDVPILLLNDAQATVLGEAERSAGDLLLAIVEFRPGDAKDVGIGVGLMIDGKLIQGRPISHLLKPSACTDNQDFVDNLGRSLALLANTMGVDNVILGGDAANTMIYDDLKKSLISYCTRFDPSRNINVRPVSLGSSAVAFGAANAAFHHVLHTRNLPIHKIALKETEDLDHEN